jgi:hypothetical protein
MERWTKVPLWSGVAALFAAAVVAGLVMLAPSGTAATAQAGVLAKSTPECTKADLSAKYKGGDAATSHVFGRIILHNISAGPCFVKGYGGLSYVGHGNGTQIGAPADRTPSKTPRTVLKPGDKVRSAVSETSVAPYPKNVCRPTKVDGFRVYPPDETHSFFIEHKTKGCANPKVHLLQHKAYH